MDYEKKYKEALERFKTFREKYCTYGELHFGDVIFDKTGEAQKDLDAIFPELKESGDERMIKAIEHILYENYSDAAVIEGVEIAEIVTWLEKHKEPIDPFDTKLFQDGVKEGRRLEREDIKKEQKPAEWSEEDKVMLNNIIWSVHLKSINPLDEMDDRSKYKKYEDFLKSLPERFALQSKQEWSENDERMLSRCVKSIESSKQFADADTFKKAKDKEIDWLKNKLKSLRPSWKPSEQEKGALRTAIHVLTEERNFPKAAAQLQNILDAFEGKESRKDWKPSEEQMRVLKQVEDRVAMKSGYWEQVLDSLYLDLIKL